MLKQTKKIIKKYGKKLTDGSISDQDLKVLLTISPEKQSLFKRKPKSGYVDPTVVNNDNFGVMDGMKDFVAQLAPKMSLKDLHDITSRLIHASPATIEQNTFMRKSCLAKVFLAYETYIAPNNAEEHYRTMRMQTEFPGANDISNLKRVILEPLIVFFEESLGAKRHTPQITLAEKILQQSEPVSNPEANSSAAASIESSHQSMPSEHLPVAPDLEETVSQPVSAHELLTPESTQRPAQKFEPIKRKTSQQSVAHTNTPSTARTTKKQTVTTGLSTFIAPSILQAKEPINYFDAKTNPTLLQLIKLCQNYSDHLTPLAIKDSRAQDKLTLVTKMLSHLQQPLVPIASQRIRNMSALLTPEAKAVLSEQRSGAGMRFLETVLHILTVGLYSKYTKNTFAFWKSHGEVLGDNIAHLTRDTNPPIK
ncbi:hypothetical protein J2N86_15250 (plasmid) [Legionella lytica]|uniref:VipE-like N-terminal domain-containing protein n=1 Tax=Legionella lytica TaxID=96232 RepID=A0ABY4YCQ9_9GAMM|nr:hypothetical protein [Legionella lytica]USQ15316.1 hypothetical protein J2N86_15250 [Legionella lytica]